MFRFNPTIREANKYLSEIVDALLKKHGGVSNEDFERNLVNTTGIGWKQVKNYKNHPKPSERLKDNAVVLKFVLAARAKDTSRKVRRISIMSISIATAVYAVYWYATKPNKVEQFIVHEVPPGVQKSKVAETKVHLTLPSKNWLFRLGPMEHSRVPIDRFTCFDIQGTRTRNCSFRDSNLQATLIIDGNIVRRYSIITYALKDVTELHKQLSEILGDQLAEFPAASKPLDERTIVTGNDLLNLIATSPGHNMRTMLTVTVSLK